MLSSNLLLYGGSHQKAGSHLPKKFVLFDSMKAPFFSHIKSTFCLDYFRQVGKYPDKKAKVNLKIYDVTNWETNNYNTHTAQHLQK